MKYKTRFLLFFVAMALFHLASNFAHPVTPTIIQELGLPDYMFGLMLAVMMIATLALTGCGQNNDPQPDPQPSGLTGSVEPFIYAQH